MLKKIIKFVSPIFILLTCFSIKATAIDKYPLWIGSTQVTSEHKSGKAGSGTWSYNPSTSTLTLNNATITNKHPFGVELDSNIYCADESLNLTIVLKGNNSLGNENNRAKDGIYTECPSLTIKGPGVLNVQSNNTGIHNNYDGPISIANGANITVKSKYGIYSGTTNIDSTNSNLTISDSSVTVKSSGNYGISSGSNLNISNSSVNVTTAGVLGIASYSNIEISGNSFVSSEGQKNAISAIGIITLSGLQILEPEGGKISSDSNYIANRSGKVAKNAIIGKLSNIAASVNPEGSGTVSGDGKYANHTSATLTATPSTEYSFVNWTEDGEEVSTDAKYTFTVTEDRTLVANFEKKENTENSESEGNSDNISELTSDSENTDNLEALNAPNTGNETNSSLWLTVLIASSMGLILVLILNKKTFLVLDNTNNF